MRSQWMCDFDGSSNETLTSSYPVFRFNTSQWSSPSQLGVLPITRRMLNQGRLSWSPILQRQTWPISTMLTSLLLSFRELNRSPRHQVIKPVLSTSERTWTDAHARKFTPLSVLACSRGRQRSHRADLAVREWVESAGVEDRRCELRVRLESFGFGARRGSRRESSRVNR